VPTWLRLLRSTDVRNPTSVIKCGQCPEDDRNQVVDRNPLAEVPLRVQDPSAVAARRSRVWTMVSRLRAARSFVPVANGASHVTSALR
jgi:hypothetical protein